MITETEIPGFGICKITDDLSEVRKSKNSMLYFECGVMTIELPIKDDFKTRVLRFFNPSKHPIKYKTWYII